MVLVNTIEQESFKSKFTLKMNSLALFQELLKVGTLKTLKRIVELPFIIFMQLKNLREHTLMLFTL